MVRFLKYSLLALAGLSTLGISACSIGEPLRSEVAMRLSGPAWMVKREIEAGPFKLTAFERMHEREKPAALYIEGNGEADFSIRGELFDATPRNPVALHLASMDKSDNVAYIARPCQYSGLQDADLECGEKYWKDAQFSTEILGAYHSAMDGIKARYGVRSFNIVGYDGGATLAALLSGQRNDVISLKTVASQFDLNALDTSLDKLRAIPQHHYIGGQDETAPPEGLHAYIQALGDTQCADYTLIQEAEHEKGWVNKWPEFLKKGTPTCYRPPEPEFVPIERPKPIYVPRMKGSKK